MSTFIRQKQKHKCKYNTIYYYAYPSMSVLCTMKDSVQTKRLQKCHSWTRGTGKQNEIVIWFYINYKNINSYI